jgi:hypothetical protein
MVKNVIIGVLVVFSLGFLIFAYYQQTIAENATSQAKENMEMAVQNLKMANQTAELAKQEAVKQKQIAEEALKKCK